MFMIENVMGIIQRAGGLTVSYAELLKEKLLQELPDGWRVEIQFRSAADSGYPTGRKRVFIIGVSPHLIQAAVANQVTPFTMVPQIPVQPLSDFLDDPFIEEELEPSVLDPDEQFKKDLNASRI